MNDPLGAPGRHGHTAHGGRAGRIDSFLRHTLPYILSCRASGKNIGVDAYRIPTELRQLLDDCRYWIEHGTYDSDEIAARFHHRLVSIHPYPNGNGRHARLVTDLLLRSMGREPFSWGGGNLVAQSDVRSRYIAALQAADKHDVEPLLQFVRS